MEDDRKVELAAAEVGVAAPDDSGEDVLISTRQGLRGLGAG